VDAKSEWRDGTLEGEATTTRPGGSAADKPFDYEMAIRPLHERPELVPGAILRVSLDTEHWLSSGTDGEIQAIVESQRVFRPVTLDKGRNVGTYAAKDRLLASGVLWPDSLEQLPRKAFLVHQPVGQGHVIAFAEDPNARAFAEATQLLFINAILFGPAF